MAKAGNLKINYLHTCYSFVTLKRIHTIPCHPQCNGQLERMNRSIIAMLESSKEILERSCSKVILRIHLYQALNHRLCAIFPPATHKTTQQMHSNFVDNWRNQMNQECNIASTNSSPRKRKDMEGHDNKCPLTAVLERC